MGKLPGYVMQIEQFKFWQYVAASELQYEAPDLPTTAQSVLIEIFALAVPVYR